MGRLTPTVMYLLIANAAVFFLSIFAGRMFLAYFSLVPVSVFPGLQVWRVVTYMFMHLDFAHIFFNMLALYFFGPPLEQIWGQNRFLVYYFLTGVGAGLVCVPFYIVVGAPDAPIIGASGAVYGLLAAFALIYPNARIYFMFLVPIKAKYLVLFFVFMEFAATASTLGGGTQGAIASVAHLSGAVIGYLYLRRFMDLKAYWLRFKQRKKPRPYRVVRNDDERGPWLH
jgi:membrane associated rhomboid family serine protease